MMNPVPTRLVNYAKNVQQITGRCERSSCYLLQQIRRYFNKHPKAFVTVEEFCVYTGLGEEEVRAQLM